MNNLVQELQQFMKERGISQNVLSKALPFSSATLSQWLAGKYPVKDEKSIKKIEDAVKDFLIKENARLEDKNGRIIIPFIQTINFRIFNEIAGLCHHYCEIGVVTGNPGVGKSTSALKYAELHPDVVYILSDRSFSAKILFRVIYERLGGSKPLGIHDMKSFIADKLKNSKRLLIIDQAEYLPDRALDLIRSLHDDCLDENGNGTMGIILTGLPILRDNLKGFNNQFAQLYQRVSWYKKLGQWKDDAGSMVDMSEEDVRSFVTSVFPNINGELKAFKDLSRCNPRVLKRLLNRSKRLCDINKSPLSEEIILKASKTIVM
jgi:DNA transposition AAA+ family ATPase